MSALSFAVAIIPFAALAVALVRGRYPGEQALSRLRARPPRRPSPAGAVLCPPRVPRGPKRRRPSISESLAGRAPPSLPSCA